MKGGGRKRLPLKPDFTSDEIECEKGSPRSCCSLKKLRAGIIMREKKLSRENWVGKRKTADEEWVGEGFIKIGDSA